jgi:hypothetical protein
MPATRTAPPRDVTPPGYGARSVYDEQPEMVTVDRALNEVAEGSTDAAFRYSPHDLDRLRKRRAELGFGDLDRVQRESAAEELKRLEAEAARINAQLDATRAVASSAESAAKRRENQPEVEAAEGEPSDDEESAPRRSRARASR